ncbi:MAG: methyltransferase domain-containing protein, partial [Alphaproteobacteria bacterium]
LGTGVAALALATRVADVRITGVELQPALCAIARENVRLNGFEEKITVVEGDVMASAQLRERGLKQESFAHVMANPPYHSQAASRASDNSAVATAYVAGADVLEKWARCLAAMAAPRASLTLIHRAQETGRVLDALSRRFGQLTLYPLFPRAGAPASRILVQGIKGSRAPLRMLPGMVLHEPGGRYTAQAERILRDGEALRLLPDD